MVVIVFVVGKWMENVVEDELSILSHEKFLLTNFEVF